MSSGYTAIEADVVEPDVVVPQGQAQSQAQVPPPPTYSDSNPYPNQATGLLTQPLTNEQASQLSWIERIKQSSHPVALVCYIFFRVGAVFDYLFGNFIIGLITSQNKFILHFISLIILISADFWNVKNISGRLLVGLRWWNEVNYTKDSHGSFENVWVFETADPNRYIHPVDSNIFWTLLYALPIVWGGLAVVSILKFQFLYLIIVGIALTLSATNAMAFTKCDKFGKANNLATSFFSTATTSLFSRFNPFTTQ
ncbi:Golgi apparatus membrane protein tvp23 [Scheffersomyces spartinae]|uniref:Golgi apparatus membrane protein TVP23 n=1 Tax=Scheffersomyces spartinae TaxID=45513 RepID=A0A9P7VDQ4_9ASCO|nr:Golgi apparatus membrane protein tvp23 [Scheffersomyces spartinae]KAG7196071.1 Golgi apparatus membrane protein tvp23 [Scheffersomyces spartinae]